MSVTNGWKVSALYEPYKFSGGDNDVPIAEIDIDTDQTSSKRWHAAIEVRGPDAFEHARLIAAAPDLLEALQAMAAWYGEEYSSITEQAEAAIARALGTGEVG